jgi:hypothetical protein
MYGIQDKINQILRGAETIRKNQSMQPLLHVNSTTTFFHGKEPQDQIMARLDKIADQILILEIEVKLLCKRLDAYEKQNQQYKKAIESL